MIDNTLSLHPPTPEMLSAVSEAIGICRGLDKHPELSDLFPIHVKKELEKVQMFLLGSIDRG